MVAKPVSGLNRVAAVVALTLTLIGCKLATPPTQSQILAGSLPVTTGIPSHWSAPTNTIAVADDWLKTFHDPRLEVLVAEAIANNLDLRQAAARVEVARQTVVVVGSQLLPHLGAQFGEGVTRDDHNSIWSSGNTGYLGVSWEPDIWGELRAQKASAQAGYEATALEFAWARQSLAATTAKAWYLAIETRQLVELAEHGVSIYAELLELVKVRHAAGKVSDLDVAESSAALSEAQSELRRLQAADYEARRALELLLSRYPSAEISVARDFTPTPPPVRAGLPAALLARRPDVLSAERQVLAAFRRQEAARLAFLPGFTLDLAGGRIENEFFSLLRLNPWLFHASVGMSVPVYTGGELTARLKIATAQEQATMAAYGATVLEAFREAENGIANEDLLAQELRFDLDALAQRTEAVRISRIQYTAGSTDLLSLLQLEAAQLSAQSAVIQSRDMQLTNRINLHLALGGSFDASPAVSWNGPGN